MSAHALYAFNVVAATYFLVKKLPAMDLFQPQEFADLRGKGMTVNLTGIKR